MNVVQGELGTEAIRGHITAISNSHRDGRLKAEDGRELRFALDSADSSALGALHVGDCAWIRRAGEEAALLFLTVHRHTQMCVRLAELSE